MLIRIALILITFQISSICLSQTIAAELESPVIQSNNLLPAQNIAYNQYAYKGKVLSKNSYWSLDGTTIKTNYHCEIYDGNSIFSAQINGVLGGRVNNHLISSPDIYAPSVNEEIWIVGNYDGITFSPVDINSCLFNLGLNENELTSIFGAIGIIESSSTKPPAINGQESLSISISNISPQYVRAGVQDTIEISGVGFEASQGTGEVLFSSSVEPNFQLANPHPTHYISWSDTLIKVIVPSNDFTSTGYTAVTGLVKVIDNNGNESTYGNLNIDFSIHNIYSSGVVYQPGLMNMNGSGGYTVHLQAPFDTLSNAINTTAAALQTWKNITNLDLKREVTLGIPLNNSDNLSTLRFDSLSVFLTSITLVHYELCGSNFYLNEIDFVLNNQHIWNLEQDVTNSNELDLLSQLTKNFGRFLLLEETNNAGSVMFHDWDYGVQPRIPISSDSLGAIYAMNHSLNQLSCGPGNPVPSTYNGVGDSLDCGVYDILTPIDNYCSGNQNITVRITNPGLDSLFSSTIGYSINGVTGSYSWTDTLLNNEVSDPIDLGLFNLLSGSNEIIIWTESPNGSPDSFTFNDTLSNNVTLNACSGMQTAILYGALQSPQSYSCQGTLPISITLDVSSISSNDLYGIEIHHSIDGIEQPVHYFNGFIAIDEDSLVQINEYDFVNASTDIKVWTAYPNGILDANPVNDTVFFSYTPNNLTTGTYTVGGTSPDYLNIADAIQDAQSRGICGDVVFDVRSGVYNEPILIWNILTLDTPLNTLTIKSEDNSVDSVRFNYARIEDNQYVTIKHIHFYEAAGSLAVYINNCKNIVLDSNRFEKVNVGSFISSYPVLPENNNSNVTISNNTFLNGGVGVYFNEGTNIEVADNDFVNLKDIAVRLIDCDSTRILGNRIHADPTLNLFYSTGIYITNLSGELKILNNEINTTLPALFIGQTQLDSSQNIIANNSMESYKSNVVEISQTTNLNFLHNTIFSNYDETPNYVLFNASSFTNDSVTFMLNNLVCTGPGTLISGFGQFYASDLFRNLDYNNYYKTGSSFSKFCPTFESFQDLWAPYQLDANSSYFNPEFIIGSTFRLKNVSSNDSLIFDIGSVFIDTDIDGFQRTGITYAGINDIQPNAIDIALNGNNLESVYCGFGDSLFVQASNEGDSTINSIQLGWKENGILQANQNYIVNLSPDEDTTLFIGSIGAFGSSVEIESWIIDINGIQDDVQTNDSISFSALTIGMSGNYIVGAAPSDFTTIQSALNALYSQGMCGEVHLLLKSGTYSGAINDFNYIPGIAEDRRVFFESQSGIQSDVTWTGNSFWNFEIFEHFTFKNMESSFFTLEKVSDIEFDNCYVKGLVLHLQSNNIRIKNSTVEKIFTVGYDVSTGVSSCTAGFVSDLYIDSCLLINVGNSYCDFKYTSRIFITNSEINHEVRVKNSFATDFHHNTGEPEIYYSINTNNAAASYLSGHRIYNNIFSEENGTFRIAAGENVKINMFHNTFNFKTGTSILSIYSSNSIPADKYIYGNIIKSNSGMTPLGLIGNEFQYLHFDYNYFDRPTEDSIVYFITGSSYLSGLSNWQTLSSGSSNSLAGQLNFETPYTGHLTPQNNSIEYYVPNIYDLTDDIDGDARQTYNTIGADEEDQLDYGIGIADILTNDTTCYQSNLSISLENIGITDLSNIDLNWTVNGQPGDSTIINVVPGESLLSLDLDSMNLNLGPNSIVVWISNALTLGDTLTGNDTLSVTIIVDNGIDLLSQIDVCDGDFINVDGPSNYNSYLWSNGDTTMSTSTNLAGYISLTAESIYGCVSTDSVLINLIPVSQLVTIDSVSACTSYTWIDGITYNSSINGVEHILANSFGCDSIINLDLTIYPEYTHTDSIETCDPYIWIDGITYYSSNGTATHTLSSTQGCDSVISLHLVIPIVEVDISNLSPTLTVDQIGGTYQWINCGTGNTPINGETGQTYVAQANGSYAVIVTFQGCTDTSSCETVANVGIQDLDGTTLILSPNPTNSGSFTIEYDGIINQIQVMDLMGRLINVKSSLTDKEVDVSAVAAGKYWVKIITENGILTKELIVVK